MLNEYVRWVFDLNNYYDIEQSLVTSALVFFILKSDEQSIGKVLRM